MVWQIYLLPFQIWPFWISMLNTRGVDSFPLWIFGQGAASSLAVCNTSGSSPSGSWRFQPHPEVSIELDAVLIPATNRVLKTQQMVNWVYFKNKKAWRVSLGGFLKNYDFYDFDRCNGNVQTTLNARFCSSATVVSWIQPELNSGFNIIPRWKQLWSEYH